MVSWSGRAVLVSPSRPGGPGHRLLPAGWGRSLSYRVTRLFSRSPPMEANHATDHHNSAFLWGTHRGCPGGRSGRSEVRAVAPLIPARLQLVPLAMQKRSTRSSTFRRAAMLSGSGSIIVNDSTEIQVAGVARIIFCLRIGSEREVGRYPQEGEIICRDCPVV